MGFRSMVGENNENLTMGPLVLSAGFATSLAILRMI